MIEYVNLKTCRKKYLLNYFGEQSKNDNCSQCDICRGTYKKEEPIEWNEIQKEIMLFFIHHDSKIGKLKAMKILKGSYDIEPKYKYWEEHGILRKHDFKDIENEFYLLLRNELLQIEKNKYSLVKLTNTGLKQLRNNEMKAKRT